MYSAVLDLHSWLRWVVLILGLVALARPAAPASRDRAGLLFTLAFDIQFLVGLALYLFISPNTRAAMQHMGEAMRVGAVRFWVVEHPTAMILALVFAHVGRTQPRRRTLFFVLAVLLLLIGMPWPGLPYGRPLFRLP